MSNELHSESTLAFCTTLVSVETAEFLVYYCQDNGFPSQISSHIQSLNHHLSENAKNISYVLNNESVHKFQELLKSPPTKAAYRALIRSLGDASKFISSATATNDIDNNPVITLGKFRIAPSYRPAEISSVCERLEQLEKGIVVAWENFSRQYFHLCPQETTIAESKIITDYKYIIQILLSLFQDDPFTIKLERVIAWNKSTSMDPSKLNISVLNHPSLISLTSQLLDSPDRFIRLKLRGEEWANSNLESTDALQALNRLLHHFRPDSTWLPQFKNKRWTQRTESLEQKISSLTPDAKLVINSIQQKVVRIAITGGMSHGKSTVLNALIGQEILTTAYRARTAWPVLIQHKPDAKHPSLTLTPEQFDPYLEKLRKAASNDPEREYRAFEDSVRVNYRLFTKGSTFSFPPGPITDPVEIKQKLAQIDDLIRLCYDICPPNDRPHMLDDDWPVLSVCMQNFQNLPFTLEFVDLPGFNDSVMSAPDRQAQLESVLRGCHAILFVFIASGETVDSENLKTQMNAISTFSTPKPILAVGTHSDNPGFKDEWTDADLNIIQSFLRRVSLEVKNDESVVTCSPRLYLSAKYAKEQAETSPLLPPFVEFEHKPGSMAILSRYPAARMRERAWKTMTKDTFITEMQDDMTGSKFGTVLQRIYNNLAMPVVKGEYFTATRKVTDQIVELRDLYKRHLDLSSSSQRDISQLLKVMESLLRRADSSSLRWETEAVFSDADSTTELKVLMEDFWERARNKASDICKGINPSNVSATRVKVIAHLDSLQNQLVLEVRTLIETIWSRRLGDLRQLLQTEHDTATDSDLYHSHISQVVDEVDRLAQRPLSQVVEELIASIDGRYRRVESPKTLLEMRKAALAARPRAEAIKLGLQQHTKNDEKVEKNVLERLTRALAPNTLSRLLPYDTASVNALTQKMDDWLGLDSLSPHDLRVIALDVTGFIGRSPILASVTIPPTDASWGAECSSDEATLKFMERMVILPWKNALEEECERTLNGLLHVLRPLGRKLVSTAIQAKIDQLKQELDFKVIQENDDLFLHPEESDLLIISQVNCESAAAAAAVIAASIKIKPPFQ